MNGNSVPRNLLLGIDDDDNKEINGIAVPNETISIRLDAIIKKNSRISLFFSEPLKYLRNSKIARSELFAKLRDVGRFNCTLFLILARWAILWYQ